MMIRSFFGLTQNPFDLRDLVLLPHQQEIHDTLKVHCQQGGLCLVLGVPGAGKSVIKQSLQRLPDNQHLVATVGRTLHTYTNTVKILCGAFRIEFDHSAFQCERRLIEQAFSLNHAGKCLTTILDDAHLMDLGNCAEPNCGRSCCRIKGVWILGSRRAFCQIVENFGEEGRIGSRLSTVRWRRSESRLLPN
jgi:vacuolar-type H+-ATPase catalytic subunit A/Vma1